MVELRVLRLEMVRRPNPSQNTKGGSHVLMITSRENPAPALPEARDARAVRGRQSLPLIEREQPQFVEVRLV